MDELMDKINGEKPQVRWVKEKMIQKYGDKIVFGKLRTVGENILNASRYGSRSNNDEE